MRKSDSVLFLKGMVINMGVGYFSYTNRENSLFFHHTLTTSGAKTEYSFHMHRSEIYVFLKGKASFSVEGNNYHLHPGDVMIFNNRELHCINVDNGYEYERIAIHFDKEYISDKIKCDYDFMRCFFARKPGSGNYIPARTAGYYKIPELILEFKKCINRDTPEDDIKARIQLFMLINAISSSIKTEESITDSKKSKTEEILDYINENIAEDLSLDSLSKKFFTSVSSICHNFKELTGFSILSYINHKRIIYAKELIEKGHSKTEACMLSGFNDYSSFYRNYKKITGHSSKKIGN